ncbi:hypothetical protein I4J48_27915 [Pseudonocardia sp. KRD-169]|nr:hypothetical protein [Pseudonocardia abyssalis]
MPAPQSRVPDGGPGVRDAATGLVPVHHAVAPAVVDATWSGPEVTVRMPGPRVSADAANRGPRPTGRHALREVADDAVPAAGSLFEVREPDVEPVVEAAAPAPELRAPDDRGLPTHVVEPEGSAEATVPGAEPGPPPADLPPCDPLPCDPLPCDPLPCDPLPVDLPPRGPRPADQQPVGSRPADQRPADQQPVGSRPADQQPVDSLPADVPPAWPAPAGPWSAWHVPAESMPAGYAAVEPASTAAAQVGSVPADPVPAEDVGAACGSVEFEPYEFETDAVGRADVRLGGDGPPDPGPVGLEPDRVGSIHLGPGHLGPGPVEPGVVEPGAVEPGTVGPNHIGPDLVGSGDVPPGAGGADPVGPGAFGSGAFGSVTIPDAGEAIELFAEPPHRPGPLPVTEPADLFAEPSRRYAPVQETVDLFAEAPARPRTPDPVDSGPSLRAEPPQVRHASPTSAQQATMLDVARHRPLTVVAVRNLLGVGPDAALHLLTVLTGEGALERRGADRTTHWVLPPREDLVAEFQRRRADLRRRSRLSSAG